MELTPFLYGLYKLAKYAIYPYTWLVALAGLILILSWLPSSPGLTRWIRRLALTIFLLIWLLGNPVVASNLLGALEMWHPPKDPTALSRHDAIVVLAGGTAAKGTLRPTTEPTAATKERLLCGIELYTRGLAPLLVMSGGDPSVIGEGPREAEAMKQFAVRLGVPEQAIVAENQSRTTYESAVGVRRLVNPQTSLLLVTSAYHMPRANQFFAGQGFSPTPYPCGYLTRNAPGWPSEWNPFDLIPNSGAFWRNTVAISELVGSLAYIVVGKA